MSNRYIEKAFLYLLTLSLLFHVAIFWLIALMPTEKVTGTPEATMVELSDLPEVPPPPVAKERHRAAEKPRRLPRASAPKVAEAPTPTPLPGKPEAQPLRPVGPTRPNLAPPRAESPLPATPLKEQPSRPTDTPISRGEGLLKPKGAEGLDRAKLFPTADKLARLEDGYRKKYSREVEEGDTKFLNTEDIQFGSFLRRFETAVYGTWHYPQAALLRGIQGVTPVRITFNRSGEISQVDLLESSGSSILDDEVMRTLKNLGPIGSFPKGYRGEFFHLIAFFHYGIGGGWLR